MEAYIQMYRLLTALHHHHLQFNIKFQSSMTGSSYEVESERIFIEVEKLNQTHGRASYQQSYQMNKQIVTGSPRATAVTEARRPMMTEKGIEMASAWYPVC